MRKTFLRQTLAGCTLCAAAAFLLPSCVDSSYDLCEDLDLTMSLGSEGLGVKLGRTQKVFLADILDTQKNVKVDGANVYYMVEDGSTTVKFEVAAATAKVENKTIANSQRVLDFKTLCRQMGVDPSAVSSVPVTGGKTFTGTAKSADGEKVSFRFENVGEEIVRVDAAELRDTPVTLTFTVKQSSGSRLTVSRVSGMRIVIPEFLKVKDASVGTVSGNVITIPDAAVSSNGELCRLTAYAVDFGKNGVSRTGSTMTLSDERCAVSYSGNVEFRAAQSFNFSSSDYADLTMSFAIGASRPSSTYSTVSVKNVTGRFNPEISPDVNPIDVRHMIPDFLDDAEVKLAVANPTMKFVADFSQIPADLNVSAKVSAVKHGTGAFTQTIMLPGAGKTFALAKNAVNTVYFHEAETPYDPNGVTGDAQKIRVNAEGNRLSSLHYNIPDEIQVDLKDGRVQIPQDKSYTVEFGKEYRAKTEYFMYVPFEFSEGLAIVYRDSTESMADDLKGWSAKGLVLTANCTNTIPLSVVGKIAAIDRDGNVLPGVRFGEFEIEAGNDRATGAAASTVTPVTAEATLDNPDDLSRIDRLVFRFDAAKGESAATHTLYSTQYLRFDDLLLKLKGAVTANFN